jgi:hypothetical protein
VSEVAWERADRGAQDVCDEPGVGQAEKIVEQAEWHGRAEPQENLDFPAFVFDGSFGSLKDAATFEPVLKLNIENVAADAE